MDPDNPPISILSSVSYVIGSINFLIGSIAFLPNYYSSIVWKYIGGITYTFGSLCFCIADIVLLHLLIAYKFPYYDRIMLILGNVIYLVGSVLFIPYVMKVDAGDGLFILGSVIMLLTRIWLYYKTKFNFPKLIIFNFTF